MKPAWPKPTWQTIAFAAWLAIGVAVAATLGPIPLIGGVSALAWVALGVPVCVALVAGAIRPGRRLVRLAQVAVMVAAVLGFDPLVRVFEDVSLVIRFRQNRATYDSVVASAKRMQAAPGRQVIDELDVEVENPPLRIAFPEPNGLLDNWCAIVFDETGELLRVSPGSPRSKLFGGDIVGCHVLDGPYLFCCLT